MVHKDRVRPSKARLVRKDLLAYLAQLLDIKVFVRPFKDRLVLRVLQDI